MAKNDDKVVDLQKKWKEKQLPPGELKKILRYLNTLQPERCTDCRFLVFIGPLEVPDKVEGHFKGWCLLRHENRRWQQEGCPSGVKKNTRDLI